MAKKHSHARQLSTGFILGAVVVAAFIGVSNNKRLQIKNTNNYPGDPAASYIQNEETKESRNINASRKIGNLTLKIPIILYHYVEYVRDPGDTIRKSLNILPSVFEQEMKDLRTANYQTYFVREIPDIMDGRKPYNPKNVVLTFDDGYEDFYTYTFPILKKYNQKATIYLINDFIGRSGFLNRQQIKEIVASGLVEIGAHTLDHIYLKHARSEVAKYQIEESKKELEQIFGIKVTTFAYPYGAYSDETVDLVAQAGFSAAVTTDIGSIQSKQLILKMPRYRSGIFSFGIISALENLKK